MNRRHASSAHTADAILRAAIAAAEDADPVPGEPAKLTADQVQAFLTHNWTQLAAKAYWGYEQQDRGCLFVFVRGMLPAKVDWRRLTGVYLPTGHLLDLTHGSELVTAETAVEIAEYVLAYDPEREAVICVAHPGWEQWAVYRAHNPFITAKRAYAQVGQQFGVEIG